MAEILTPLFTQTQSNNMDSEDKTVRDTAAPEVRKLMGDEAQNAATSHEERRNSKDDGRSKRDDPSDGTSAHSINQKKLPDDGEQYAHEDNVEARDSRQPYEDVITPESYDDSLEGKATKEEDSQ